MKHRSVIGFVIVAAVLFSLPQLSHDLRELKGEVGSRLHRELLHAFLNLSAGEPTAAAAAAPVAPPAESLLASCPKERSRAESAARSGKVGASGRSTGKGFEQSAMIGDPKNDPINEVAGAEFNEAAASRPAVKVASEVAMIIPPESGIDPRPLATSLTSRDVARIEADKLRVEAEGMRVAYTTGVRFEANGPEWQKVTAEAVRELKSLPGTYEFRVLRDGTRVKVLKLKCGDCPAGAPRTPTAPRRTPAAAPLPPALFTSAEWAGE